MGSPLVQPRREVSRDGADPDCGLTIRTPHAGKHARTPQRRPALTWSPPFNSLEQKQAAAPPAWTQGCQPERPHRVRDPQEHRRPPRPMSPRLPPIRAASPTSRPMKLRTCRPRRASRSWRPWRRSAATSVSPSTSYLSSTSGSARTKAPRRRRRECASLALEQLAQHGHFRGDAGAQGRIQVRRKQ